MAAKDIKDEDSLKRWLSGRPIEDTRVIAARAALRKLPWLREVSVYGSGLGIALSLWRANEISWCMARYKHRAKALEPFARAAERALQPINYSFDASTLRDAGVPALSAVRATIARTRRGAVSEVVGMLSVTIGDHHNQMMGEPAELEATLAPDELAAKPLWSVEVPADPSRRWLELKFALLSRPATQHWEVWTDWYEARLRGEPGDEDEDIARVMHLRVSDQEWDSDPTIANKRIKDIVARFRAPAAPKLPPQWVSTDSAKNSPNAATTTTPITTPSATIKAHVFISHATQADGARASGLTRDLEAASTPCWIAPRDIPSGADWNGAIMSAIDTCEAMILLVSDAALKSPFVNYRRLNEPGENIPLDEAFDRLDAKVAAAK